MNRKLQLESLFHELGRRIKWNVDALHGELSLDDPEGEHDLDFWMEHHASRAMKLNRAREMVAWRLGYEEMIEEEERQAA